MNVSDTPPHEFLYVLAALLAENPVSMEQVIALCGTLKAGDVITPHDHRWREIRLMQNFAELSLLPAEPIPAAEFRAWFPALTEIVGKSHLPRRFLVDVTSPGKVFRVRLVARVERDAITEITLLREKRG